MTRSIIYAKVNSMNNNLSRRDFLKTIGIGTAGLALPTAVLAMAKINSSFKRPNVLFIAVDDLRPQLNCYGHKQMISPNIDRLGEEGIIFSRAYCQVPVCGASRASLLTGAMPTRERFVNFTSRADKDLFGITTLPEHFKDNGYYTVSLGKVFHHRDDSEANSWSEAPWRPEGVKGWQLEQSYALAAKNRRSGRGPAYECADSPDSAYPDGLIAEKAISDMRRLKDTNKPFFLAVGFYKPHLPFCAPKKYWDLYKRREIDLADNPFRPKGCPDVALTNWGELRSYAEIPQEGPVSDKQARSLIHGYYACTSFVDAQIGKVVNELDKLGLRDNTIIVLWGDHGWQLGEHGLWCKHTNFENSLHSPLIVKAAGIKGGQKTDALVGFIDIYPSLCELAGLSKPKHLEGKSFVPLMKNPDRHWSESSFSRWREGESIKTDRYRYTEWTDENGKIFARMLYDHKTDPAENKNIFKDPENKEVVHRLGKMIHKELKRRELHSRKYYKKPPEPWFMKDVEKEKPFR